LSLATPKSVVSTHKSSFVIISRPPNAFWKLLFGYRVPYAVNISSSVVNSKAVDDYTETKKAQEALTAASGIKQVVLRPTLMLGWFDRKHVGWLARFMQKTPVFLYG
jgi:uncharacterized protein YbjT (DUF2867 family)